MTEKILALQKALRDVRIKYAIDYALTHKYGALHVLCDEVWVPAIKEEAELLGLTIDSWHTYGSIIE